MATEYKRAFRLISAECLGCAFQMSDRTVAPGSFEEARTFALKETLCQKVEGQHDHQEKYQKTACVGRQLNIVYTHVLTEVTK